MQKYCFFSIICYVEFQKTAYQKSGHSHFTYSNKRKMAKIAYQDKRKTVKIAYRDKHFLPFSLSQLILPLPWVVACQKF